MKLITLIRDTGKQSKMLSKCCCCIPLRTGSLILAILGILCGIGTVAQYREQWGGIIQGIFYLLAYGSLLYGALKYNEKAVLTSLVITGLSIALGIIICIIAIANIETFNPQLANNCAGLIVDGRMYVNCDDVKSAAIGLTAGVFIIGSILNAYFWICNYSFYKELKEGGGGSSV